MQVFDALTNSTINVPAMLDLVNSQETGGVVMFSGIVRNNSKGRTVNYLEYEAYEPLARKKIMEIIHQAREKWQLTTALCIHRLGKLQVGECAVLVITASAHRNEAYEANRFIIDTVKAEVPIWKNEYFADGSSEWGRNDVMPKI
jgi:molybdopterin synthase catalytic subunit